MKIYFKSFLLGLIVLKVISCQKPIIKEITLHPEIPIITANQNFERTGFHNFFIKDSLILVNSEDLIGLPFASFIQYSGELIFTTHNGYLYFISLTDFANIRKIHISDGSGTAPSVYGTTLFIAANNGDEGLLAYDMLTGKTKWAIEGMLSQSSPIITGKYVIHATLKGEISAYNIIDGTHAWEVDYNDAILNNLAMIGENLIVASQNGIISNYNTTNGVLNWSLKINDAVYASPVVNEEFVFVTTYGGSIIKINLLSGNIKNRLDGKMAVFQTPVLGKQNIYVFYADGNLMSVNTKQFKIMWQNKLDGPFSASPLLGNSEILAGTESKKFYRINKMTGEIIQTINLEGRLRTQPTYYKDKFYISYEPDIIAIFSSTGKNDD